MESLALLVALVTLSIVGIGVLAVAMSLAGWRAAGGMVGVVAVAAGIWLGVTVPHAWGLWLIPLACGAWAVVRNCKQRGHRA